MAVDEQCASFSANSDLAHSQSEECGERPDLR